MKKKNKIKLGEKSKSEKKILLESKMYGLKYLFCKSVVYIPPSSSGERNFFK